MTAVDPALAPNAGAIFRSWLARFAAALEKRDAETLAGMFGADGYWKDYLSFSWEHRTFSGPSEIRDAFAASLPIFRPRAAREAIGRSAPKLLRRSAKKVIEGFFDFDVEMGRGTAFVRLLHDELSPDDPKIWLMLTSLQELRGFEEKIGARRPSGDEYAMNTTPNNWQDDFEARRLFADRDPEVIIVGAGHAGLILAARLRQMGVDTLVVEKNSRIGDVWRNRYHSLTLHNESTANHMPYMPFPETWPVWLPKDQLAGWLEAYAQAMELNVWTETSLAGASFDEASGTWSVDLRQGMDGSGRRLRCRHLVIATGVSGSVPNIADIPGLSDFNGEVRHSGEYTRGAAYAGKRALVIGTGNSAHDVAQDLHVNGAAQVALYQRSPTCVVSLVPSAAMVFKIYSEGPVDEIDLLTSAIPFPVLEDTYKFMTKRAGDADKEMLDALNKAGFETYFGRDGTGFHMMYLRGEGGYYINVGCSDLIIEGKVGVVQARDADRFVAEGLRMKDGTIVPLDLVVLATGFRNMQEGIRQMLGDEIADALGPVWGFDQDYQMRNMWRRTARDGLWLMGGALIDARLYSRFLAIEIKASLEGLLPDRASMPIIPRTRGDS
ncbi:NAD(P)/FAD-dependent oxidoreductase [Xanthobacter dioxanivorans]|uniref:NAD(P)/FAD-dependent oxidoreductase n=1 Tax=Xanthobacter dioxanivorans TaxID=2528964 RepID=A0A974SKL6_9HYPH|nr:NAD(P)/FAD-dependent oxidoreductase [Xanthobacter dioxanivorans]QRG08617.1 NAD(P)/FAD-dependent oxidoreductase [Xanthobacter dioxanivorans]